MKKYLPYLSMVLLVSIDQLVKWWVLSHSIFAQINPNFIFGLGQNWDLFFWVSCVLILILFLLTNQRPILETYILSVILAGALGNLIDRIFRGGVVDYLKIDYFHTELVFNLADIILILGVCVYAWHLGKENLN